MNCRGAVHQYFGASVDPDARAACHILSRALEAPARTLLTNAGFDPAECLAQVDGSGMGFDVETGQIADMSAALIVDPAEVMRCAVQVALSGVIMALTTGVLVHHRNPDGVLEP